MTTFSPEKDIPNLTGRVCLVTGANSGLGEATVAALAQHNPARIYLAARSVAKAEDAVSRIRTSSPAASSVDIEILEMDVSSFDSVREAAARVNQEVDRLDLLQLNAGIGMIPHATTVDGYEVHFGTNYLGHALLTQLLMPKLLATAKLPGADVRVVSVSSITHRTYAFEEGIIFDGLKSDMKDHGAHTLYGQLKLAQILFTSELARRYPQIISTSVHPGVVKSNIWYGEKGISGWVLGLVVRPYVAYKGVSVEQGVKGQLWCSFDEDVVSGEYYEPLGRRDMASEVARDEGLARELWDWTEGEFKALGMGRWPAS